MDLETFERHIEESVDSTNTYVLMISGSKYYRQIRYERQYRIVFPNGNQIEICLYKEARGYGCNKWSIVLYDFNGNKVASSFSIPDTAYEITRGYKVISWSNDHCLLEIAEKPVLIRVDEGGPLIHKRFFMYQEFKTMMDNRMYSLRLNTAETGNSIVISFFSGEEVVISNHKKSGHAKTDDWSISFCTSNDDCVLNSTKYISNEYTIEDIHPYFSLLSRTDSGISVNIFGRTVFFENSQYLIDLDYV